MKLTSKSDPTKTLVIRNRATREIDRRFSKIRRFVRESIFVGKLVTNVVSPRQYEFIRDKDKIAEFNRWLQVEIDKEILGIANGTIEPKNHWLNVHVGQGYERGAKKTRVLAERGIKSLVVIPDYHPFANPAHIDRAEFLFTRVFNDMKGLTDTMKSQMNRVLSNGMIQGLNPKTVAKDMVGRIDSIGIVRAKLIARTEIVEAHNQASILEGNLIAKETGIKEQYKWLTSLDGRERDKHRAWHNKVYTPNDVSNMIGEPNCRCSVSLYIDIKNL